MAVVTQNVDDLSVVLNIKVAQEDYEPRVDKALKKARQSAQIKGFRPGMAPMGIIKKMHGTNILVDELNKIVSEELDTYIKSNNKTLIGEPIPSEAQKPIDWENQKDFEFAYDLAYYPELNIELDESIKLPFYKVSPKKDELDDELEFYRRNYGSIQSVDVSEKDDMIRAMVELPNLNKTEESDSETVEKEVSLLINTMEESNQKKMIGKKVGGSAQLEIRKAFVNETDLVNMLGIPRDALDQMPEKLSFKVTNISRLMPSELNQEFFDKVTKEEGKVTSEEGVREFLESQANVYYEKLGVERIGFDAKDILIEKANIKLPTEFIKRLLTYLNQENEKVTPESIEAELPLITEDLSWQYIQDTLLTKYEVKIEPEEVKAQARENVASRLRQYGISDFSMFNVDELAENALKNQDEFNNIVRTIKFVKLSQLLRDKAKFTTKEVTLEEYNKLFEAPESEEPKKVTKKTGKKETKEEVEKETKTTTKKASTKKDAKKDDKKD